MTDTVSQEKRSRIMSQVRGSDTEIEKRFRSFLWKAGIRYRKNNKKYFGKPDITIAKHKTVIFIDSCFWHGCEEHLRIPKTNIEFWKKKIERNVQRDREVKIYYQDKKWKIIRIWEHDLKDESFIAKIIKGLKK